MYLHGYTSLTSYNNATLPSVVRSTVTATPNATTIDSVSTLTVTVETTTTTTPAPVSIPAPSSFIPLVAVQIPQPTAVSRVKRAELSGRDVLAVFRRQTPAGFQGGFGYDGDDDDLPEDMNRGFQRCVDCWVATTVNAIVPETVPGPRETVFLGAATLIALETSMVSTMAIVNTTSAKNCCIACQNTVSLITILFRNRFGQLILI